MLDKQDWIGRHVSLSLFYTANTQPARLCRMFLTCHLRYPTEQKKLCPSVDFYHFHGSQLFFWNKLLCQSCHSCFMFTCKLRDWETSFLGKTMNFFIFCFPYLQIWVSRNCLTDYSMCGSNISHFSIILFIKWGHNFSIMINF